MDNRDKKCVVKESEKVEYNHGGPTRVTATMKMDRTSTAPVASEAAGDRQMFLFGSCAAAKRIERVPGQLRTTRAICAVHFNRHPARVIGSWVFFWPLDRLSRNFALQAQASTKSFLCCKPKFLGTWIQWQRSVGVGVACGRNHSSTRRD